VPVGEEVPPQTASSNLASSNAVGEFPFKAATACQHAPEVLVVLDQSQAAPAAEVEFGHLPWRNTFPQALAFRSGGSADKVYHGLGFAGGKVHREAETDGGLDQTLCGQGELVE
jgi:hypothetical protein